MGYLSKQALQGLKHYVYKPGGYTILDNWHQPFWNFIVELFPMWLAPNLITLTGLTAVFAATLAGSWYDFDMLSVAPRWVFGAMALAQLFYLHVDCLDGKQARRTGSSSPLGQLFDHGCDALVVQLVVATLATSMDLTPDWRLTLGNLVVFTPFVMAHWEEYHTGTMIYGNGLWGVTEANYAVVVLHAATYFLGTEFWTEPVLSQESAAGLVAGIRARTGEAGGAFLDTTLTNWLAELSPNTLALLGLTFMGSMMLIEQITRVFLPSASDMTEREAHAKERGDHRQHGRRVALSHAVQIVGFLALGGALVQAPERLAGPVRLRMATFGTAYALQNTRLIMAHMAKVPFRIAMWPLAAMALQLGNVFFPVLEPVALCIAVTTVTLVGYFHYVVSIIREICSFLGIQALTITPKRTD